MRRRVPGPRAGYQPGTLAINGRCWLRLLPENTFGPVARRLQGTSLPCRGDRAVADRLLEGVGATTEYRATLEIRADRLVDEALGLKLALLSITRAKVWVAG
jgi:hypothetical protein